MVAVKIPIVSFYSMFSRDVLLVPRVCIILCSLLINAEKICDWETNALNSSKEYSSIRLAVPKDVDEVEVNDVPLTIENQKCLTSTYSIVHSCQMENYTGYTSLLINFTERAKVKYVHVRSGHSYVTAQTVPSKSPRPNEYGFVLTEDQQFHICPSAGGGDSVELTWTVEANNDSGTVPLLHYGCTGSDGFYCLDTAERDPKMEAQLKKERSNSTEVDFKSKESVAALFYSTKCIVEKTSKGFRHRLNVTRPENENVAHYFCYISPSNDPYLSYTIDWTGVGNE
ncbi:hypothetical protein SprV_0702441700 [Sparganum proliferum]